jgi:hypothetical protein
MPVRHIRARAPCARRESKYARLAYPCRAPCTRREIETRGARAASPRRGAPRFDAATEAGHGS